MLGNFFFSASAGGYEIKQSLRFNSADSAYLERTTGATAGNQTTWTFSCWIKRAKLGTTQHIFNPSVGGDGTNESIFRFETSDKIRIYDSGATRGNFVTSQVFRDTSAWYHIVAVLDTSQGTSTDRFKLYVNGTQVTAFDTASYPGSSVSWGWNRASTRHRIGAYAYPATATNFGDFYQSEINFIDGSALDPTSFGEPDDNGVWRPKKYAGSYTGNSFYLKFASGDGTDSSGLSNTWTANNFTTSGTGTDVMSDTPTTNWCTWNPLKTGANLAPADGNLYAQMTSNASGVNQSITGTVHVSSGKWYWETTSVNTLSGYGQITGIASQDFYSINSFTGGTNQTFGYEKSGNAYNGTTFSSYGATYVGGDIIGVALDLDVGTLEFYKNGTSQGVAFTGLSGTFAPYAGLTYSGGGPGFTANFGQRDFAYTPPTGFKALNTANLPAPTIKDGSKYFNTVLYTGDGTSSRSITGMGFQPDFLWLKPRSTRNHSLVDVLRGTNHLQSNNTNSEVSVPSFDSFDADGFTVTADGSTNPNWNESPEPNVVWGWLAGGSGSSNTDGSITSTVSANPSAGFSIVSYTGNVTSGATIGHGLGIAPSLVIVKNRDSGTQPWRVYHSSLGATKALRLNDTTSAETDSAFWNNTAPSSSLITLGNDNSTNATGDDYIAYCFAEVESYSKIGSYVGNGSTDGPFVYCGFRPKFVMAKLMTTSGWWVMIDSARNSYNVVDDELVANGSYAENGLAITTAVDFTANGFKIRTSDANWNSNTQTLIFVAFAENPLGGDGVSPATAR